MEKFEIERKTGLSSDEIRKKIDLAKSQIERINKENLDPEKKISFATSFIEETETREYYGVLVKIPVAPKLVKSHILAFFIDNLKSIQLGKVAEHYFQGDVMYKTTDGKTKPRVVRYYFISPNDFGRKKIVDVKIEKKVDLVTGNESLILSIYPRTNSDQEKPQMRMIFGTPLTGGENEHRIPETDSCIRFEKIVPFTKKP